MASFGGDTTEQSMKVFSAKIAILQKFYPSKVSRYTVYHRVRIKWPCFGDIKQGEWALDTKTRRVDTYNVYNIRPLRDAGCASCDTFLGLESQVTGKI